MEANVTGSFKDSRIQGVKDSSQNRMKIFEKLRAENCLLIGLIRLAAALLLVWGGGAPALGQAGALDIDLLMSTWVADGFTPPLPAVPDAKRPHKRGKSAREQPVAAIGHGTVVSAITRPGSIDNWVRIQHHYLENDALKTIVSEYGHLQTLRVRPGQWVDRGDTIGTVGKRSRPSGASPLHFQIRTAGDAGSPAVPHPSRGGQPVVADESYLDNPLAFVKNHRRLLVPGLEDQFVLVVKHQYKMYLYRFGSLHHTYEIALSVTPKERKERTRDFKVPEGLYRICQKLQGPFANDAAAESSYIGPRWLRLSYPNRHDALRGLRQQFITRDEYKAILSRLQKKETPPQDTFLGGGIGIHGWSAADWKDTRGRNLTWGCISMHNADLLPFYDTVRIGTQVLIVQ
ncbi:MAG: peptidoglycan DD-metalloendopeptidase family protein [Desulfobacterales bacterium]|nr:peptidoglycan DD-metalloendopeptidase family protein [Desulfobacterales bacterium]